MTHRIFYKLVFVFAVFIAATTIILDVAITHSWQGSLRSEIENSLAQRTALFALQLTAHPACLLYTSRCV